MKLTTYLPGCGDRVDLHFHRHGIQLSDTPYFGQLLPTLGGGAVCFIVLVPMSAPVGDEHRECFVWHLRIVPRLAIGAGFELPEDTVAGGASA